MALSLRESLGALQERDFRLLFSGTVITTVGDGLAGIALAFAVLDIGSATDLGIVFAARQGAEAIVLVLGGVISDRLPRNIVMVGASIIQGVAQAATAVAVLGGFGSIVAIVAFQVMYGIGAGLVVPAEVGLVPQTVSAERLQQANALQGLSRNLTRVLGPALGGALVVAGSPGTALGIDAVSFLVCAVILWRIRIPARADGIAKEGFFHELRAGLDRSSRRGRGCGPRRSSSASATSGSARGSSSGPWLRRRSSEGRGVGHDRRNRRRRSHRRERHLDAASPEAPARGLHRSLRFLWPGRFSCSQSHRPSGCFPSHPSAPEQPSPCT